MKLHFLSAHWECRQHIPFIRLVCCCCFSCFAHHFSHLYMHTRRICFQWFSFRRSKKRESFQVFGSTCFELILLFHSSFLVHFSIYCKFTRRFRRHVLKIILSAFKWRWRGFYTFHRIKVRFVWNEQSSPYTKRAFFFNLKKCVFSNMNLLGLKFTQFISSVRVIVY